MKLFNLIKILIKVILQIKIKVYDKELTLKYRSVTLVISEEDFYLDVERDITIDCGGYISLCPPAGFDVRQEQERLKEDAQHIHQPECSSKTQGERCSI